jgi:hypothetical protein
MLHAIPFVILAAVAVLMLVYRERFGRALRASSRGFGAELGGPLGRWTAPPEGSRGARFQNSYTGVFIVVFALIWIGVSVYGIVRAVE